MSKVCIVFLATAFVFAVSTDIAFGVSLLTVPRSAVVLKGDGVELNCRTNGSDKLQWNFTSWVTSNETTIYLGKGIIESVRSRYSIDNSTRGQHNLIINSTDMAHAGRYMCRSIVDISVQAAAQLTVLESNPECGANASLEDGAVMDNSHLRMWCRATYAGFMIPVFSWTKNNTQNAIVANTTTSADRAVPLTTTSSVITKLNSSDNGVTFRCKISFQLPNITYGNAPDYEYTWNYTVYGPRNLSIVRIENHLECSADSNPPPTYTWTHVEKNTTKVGCVFELDGAYNEEQTLQCTPVNAISTENINVTVRVKNSSTGGFDKFLITVAAAIGGPVVFLLIIVIIICCVVRRKRLKGNTSARPDVALETDINSYDDIDLSSGRSPICVRDGNSSKGRSNDSMIADNLVYAEVKKPKGTREEKRATNDQPSAIYADVKKKVNVNGSSTGRNGANLGENPQPSQTPNPGNKNCIGDDGTVYAELGEMKQQPTNKVQSAKPPVFSQVEIYASIDHRGIVPPPPPKL